ncbi:allophanate hydrolase [Kibdelosporangium banguiense]|uniref:Allophanate hydrolase n=1 Tax=Kibdelosporangium banguiense TaxID=1365924 RepID=A0ABS4TTN4_9PSEU|nr:allophanate hydrolase [Kibdelosporangium banguiense]MBP2327354.1 allophanate hydrolase [Kibdelosporangium banguiense]
MNRVSQAYERIRQVDRPEIWIDLRPQDEVQAEFAAARGPLAGKLVAVKGNIDVAGLPTTAACPAYAYQPSADAPVIAQLRAAGAVVLGTTNMDQFATGLVGTRSPHGAVRNAIDPARVSGGSSSGSAVAVALGIVDIALGTDTAGSGRVPAAFNGIVGLKPTYGLISTDGVVPACRSLDCVSIFARTVREASQALACVSAQPPAPVLPLPYRLGVPSDLGALAPGWAEAFAAAASRFAGATLVPIDISPFVAVARLLYEGSFVAERYTAVGEFIDAHRSEVDPTVAAIISSARDVPAHKFFRDQEELARLDSLAAAQLDLVDALLIPTTVEHPTIAEVEADPIGVNARLGRFTNFANLLGLAALAIPAGTVDGLPFGVSLVGKAFTDNTLAAMAEQLTSADTHAHGEEPRDEASRPAGLGRAATQVRAKTAQIAVVGAHLTGQPLNNELVSRGGVLTQQTKTAPAYRLYALDTVPPKPGLVRDLAGAAVEAEVWELPVAEFGSFVAALPSPMAIGKVELADGTWVPGFTCERHALTGAEEITSYGGWRAYLNRG